MVKSVGREHADTRPSHLVVETISADEQERFVSILSFWHKLEFFIPFDLDQRIAEVDERKVRYLHRQDLDRGASSLWQAAAEEDEEVKRFQLYLGVFDKSEIAKVCNRILGTSKEASDEEEFERTELEGRTCFAQLTFDPTGELVLEAGARSGPVSYVSALPWALGQFGHAGLASLTSDRFESAKRDLGDLLLNFKAARRFPPNHKAGECAGPITHAELLELYEILQNWAGFSIPEASLIGILEIVTGKKKKKEQTAEEISVKEELQADVAILNSFFIQDLESAIKSVRSGQISSALKQYLSPLPAEDRVDLESASGLRAIVEMLHPARLNRGRWLSDPHERMTLMQQFAINSMGQDSAGFPSLFSVNGPPGTGKTTLLRDIFADLIVRRARVLAKLNKPSEAFLPDKAQVLFRGRQDRTISILRPELTGFEMVVASSNNAAAENISSDLPKTGKLGELWRASEYLKGVAYKVAAQQEDGSFKKLPESDLPWGLISCALGNSRNRRRFKERFCYMEVPEGRKPSWQIADRPQHIRKWIDKYRGPVFATAKEAFRRKDEEVEKTCARLMQLAELLPGHLDGSYEQKIVSAHRRVEECREEDSKCRRERRDLEALIERLQNSMDGFKEDERLLNRSRPAWWDRVWRTSLAKFHQAQVRENASAQLRVRGELSDLKARRDGEMGSRLTVLSNRLVGLEDDLKFAEAEKKSFDERFAAAKSEFVALRLPEKLDELGKDEFQRSGLWHSDVLAQQRSELFMAALSLHEAWLAAVGRSKAGFRPNILAIADLLSGRRLERPSDALPIWQSLFLMVPIVSTTFASFRNQFGDLGPGSLGWLFIDEAGQAVPQAAVGAIWRAKRALVMGDPLQIEPVFTLPSRFISAVAELSPYTAGGSYSPDRTSVQRLADDANRFGVSMGSEDGQRLWVGSPLRMHYRCIDPMFSWSNAIAYDGKMIFGLRSRSAPNGPPIPCESARIDIKGSVRKRQEVGEQTQFVLDLLGVLYRRDGHLPGLYFISPFKAIKSELTRRILEEFDGPAKHELKKWCTERVGTVHTFQGKEEHSVLMILGADSKHAGSADWACAKPNILNVGLTRARRRFYVVGDRDLWGARGPFAWSADRLPTKTAIGFLRIARSGSALGQSTG